MKLSNHTAPTVMAATSSATQLIWQRYAWARAQVSQARMAAP